MCLAGFGIQGNGTTCTPCAYGTFQAGGGTTCSACPATTFYAPVDGAGPAFTTTGVTLYTGSNGQDACVPKQSQLSQEAGQAYFAPGAAVEPLFTTAAAADLATCLAQCSASSGQACMAQYDVVAKACKTLALPLAASDATNGTQLLYKLPPSVLGSASSITVGAKTLSSGFYAHTDVTLNAATWESAGTNLGTDARTFVKGAAQWATGVTRDVCSKACDASNVCWGFLYNPAGTGSCLYRGGVDALATRAVFTVPDAAAASLAALKW